MAPFRTVPGEVGIHPETYRGLGSKAMLAIPRAWASMDAKSAPVRMHHTRMVLSPDAEMLPSCQRRRGMEDGRDAHVLFRQPDGIDGGAMTPFVGLDPDRQEFL